MSAIIPALAKSDGEGNERLAELAVEWVLRNPEPVALEAPAYKR